MLSHPRILIAEDESGIADTLQYVLQDRRLRARVVRHGRGSHRAVRGRAAGARHPRRGPARHERLRALQAPAGARPRAGGAEVPMLFLTARSDEIDRVVGLELGADDYIAKPFSPRELVARVRTILRRSGRGNGHAPASIAPAPRRSAATPRPSRSMPSACRSATTAACSNSRATNTACCACWCSGPAASSRATSCSSSCGTTPARASTARSTPTSRPCAPSCKRRRARGRGDPHAARHRLRAQRRAAVRAS